jgi:hypothetical protein
MNTQAQKLENTWKRIRRSALQLALDYKFNDNNTIFKMPFTTGETTAKIAIELLYDDIDPIYDGTTITDLKVALNAKERWSRQQ